VSVELVEAGGGRTEMRFEQRATLSPGQSGAARYAWSRIFDHIAERLAAGPGRESRRTRDDESSGRH
jgi:hypothetical protein